jgi:hypothetical protein
MRKNFLHAALGALLLAALAVPAADARQGEDYVSSDNIELVQRIKTVGDGVGARVVGNYLYVTSTQGLSIFDISKDPEKPVQVGQMTFDVEWENEEVPTNGKILGISAQIGCKDPTQSNVVTDNPLVGNQPSSTDEATGCLSLYDVSNPASVKFLRSVSGAGDHTSTCVYDCKYFWGDDGAVTDARDPAKAKVVGNWQAKLPKRDYDGNPSTAPTTFAQGCHHIREVQPGIIFGSCQPLFLFSTRPEHGGSITEPVILAEGKAKDIGRFIHSNQWPGDATDKFAFAGGETNANPECDDTENTSAFMVFDTTGAIDGRGGFRRGGAFSMISEVRPTNGNYFDGKSPYNGLGCSVHWFQHHPQFRNGGAVALAEYENGTRLLQITSTGKIVEQGYFLPLGGSTSAPHWAPNGKVIYAIDYTRGVDVLRYTGPTYRPNADGTLPDEPGTTPGTDGARNQQEIDAFRKRQTEEAARRCDVHATAATARRAGRGLRLGAGGARFDAQVFQLSGLPALARALDHPQEARRALPRRLRRAHVERGEGLERLVHRPHLDRRQDAAAHVRAAQRPLRGAAGLPDRLVVRRAARPPAAQPGVRRPPQRRRVGVLPSDALGRDRPHPGRAARPRRQDRHQAQGRGEPHVQGRAASGRGQARRVADPARRRTRQRRGPRPVDAGRGAALARPA